MKKVLTDRGLKALKPAKPGSRYEVGDAVVPGLAVRITASGQKSFVLIARYPGSPNPTRRAIGEYGAISLDDARNKARNWLALLGSGKDPKAELERARQAELRKQAHSFGAVAEEYFASKKFKKLRTAHDVKRDLNRLVVSRWKDRAVADIARQDVRALIKEIAADKPYMAHLTLAYTRSMFNWICEEDYGVEVSPCAMIKPKDLIGSKEARQRILSDDELKELWHAADCVGYPFGPMVKLLLLTGVRRDEAAGARWSEIDLDKRVWVIPAERFKSGTQHLVPLTDQALAVLDGLPRFAGNDHLFTTGKGAVSGFSRAKERIDQIMAVHLKPLEPWRLHDIRRTFRSGLASLRVPDSVAELALGHGKKGLQKVYDLYRYEPELREALTLWGARVRDLVMPPPKNVHQLRRRKA